MRILPLAVLLALLSGLSVSAEEVAAHEPKLLLTSKLARRLSRDRERQTPRWINFENRVKSVPDSSERGFELALYFVVTRDAGKGREAVEWALGHPNEIRQRALVLDWCGEAATETERAALRNGSAPSGATFQARRDCLFSAVTAGRDGQACVGKDLPTDNLLLDPAELYAACEYFLTQRMNGGDDQRHQDPTFFQHLPVEFLLARKPEQVERPDWMSHVAALALVTLDPNLEASQFLQGWAIEDRQILHDGPGVGYELLWADPYLPGIAYQNLDPWIYESGHARLFARSDWTAGACWISISASGLQQQACPKEWQDKSARFGSLKLIPAPGKCWDIPHQDMRDNLVIWKLKAGEKISYHETKETSVHADEAGMWHPGTNVEGKACLAK